MNFVPRELRVAGSTLFFREAGSGPPLLFLHGSGGADSALPFLLGFADRMRVVVPDHPGFGRSPDPPWLDTIGDAAFAYLDFLDAMDLPGVHLVGTSLGGWIALEVAIRNATRLAALTVIGAAGIRPGEIAIGDLFRWGPEERVRRLVASEAFADKLLALKPTPEQAEVARRNEATTVKLCNEPRFSVIPDCGHLPAIEKPEELAALVELPSR